MGGGETAAHAHWAREGTGPRTVAACLEAAPLRAAPSRPERATAAETLGGADGWVELDLEGYMGMGAIAGQ